MPTGLNINLAAGTLPSPLSPCPANWQAVLELFVANMTAQLPGQYNTFNYGDSTPAVGDRTKPWFRTISGEPDGWYNWSTTFGGWVRKHEKLPGEIILYEGSQASIATFDGGNAVVVGKELFTGPMWEEVTQLQGRVPLGPGTLPLQAVNVAVTGTGGADKINSLLALNQLPPHSHKIGVELDNATFYLDAADRPKKGSIDDDTGNVFWNSSPSASNHTVGETEDTPAPSQIPSGQQPLGLNNMPPYYGIFFIRRTSRLYHHAV